MMMIGTSSPSLPKPPMLSTDGMSKHSLTPDKRTIVHNNSVRTTTSLPKVIWEQGRVVAAVPGAGWHKGLRIRNVCIVLVKDRCANVRYFSVRKQE